LIVIFLKVTFERCIGLQTLSSTVAVVVMFGNIPLPDHVISACVVNFVFTDNLITDVNVLFYI